MGHDGSSNWAQRWPVMQAIINRAQWDVVCLQEVEQTDAQQISDGFGAGYTTFYFKHEKRPPDGLMIAVKSDTFEASPSPQEIQDDGVAFGSVDVVHRKSGRKVRIVTAHARGGRKEQLEALSKFADGDREDSDLTIVTGDFNEDFGRSIPFQGSPRGRYTTLVREAGLPDVSRPPHKQDPAQKSGKGKIDWIFVRGARAELFRDSASRLAMLTSHAPCSATGNWPSDHGAEGLSVRLSPARAEVQDPTF